MEVDKMKKQREDRRKNNNVWTKKYEKTPKGFLVRMYRNMLSRTSGVQKKKAHLYKGKELLDKHEFYAWAFLSKEFKKMYDIWVDSDFNRKLTPTVDRIDSSLGYTPLNMEWVTHSENSRRGGKKKVEH